MGGNLCTLRRPILDQNSKSFKEFIKPKCMKKDHRRSVNNNLKRKIEIEMEMKADEKKIPKARELTLEDWILASPGLKPEYLRRGELCAFKQSKKKVHPFSIQFRRSLLGEAKDSLSLDRHRPMNGYEESEGMSTCSRVSVKSQKRVRFKLPHNVILYSPDEPYCNEASLSSPEDSFSPVGPNCTGNSFDTAEEPYVRLAVHTLPPLYVSSRI